MKVKLTLIDDMLGTACANPDVHKEFIASKSKDAEKVQEEIASLPADVRMEKALTVFSRNESGEPVLWDYQIKGFIKEAIGALVEIADKEVRIGKTKLSKFTFKRIVDNYVFVTPRQMSLGKIDGICTRPLRATTMQGERVSLASSEVVKSGASVIAEITTLTPALDDLIRQALDYGKLKGLGQWRNSGKGRFEWQELK